MTGLLARIHANLCKVRDCTRERMKDSDCCRDCTVLKWQNRLDRVEDGYVVRRSFAAKDYTGEVRTA